MSDTATMTDEHAPTVYFIDDSATMREVIKIAFRRESINIITCHDAASALSQFATTTPDVVITDVIMPDKDGYEVCQAIKQNPDLSKTPVILMSGVVNRTVAEKAIAAQADELIRKPFQPQDLIARVKKLLNPEPEAVPSADLPSSDTSRKAPETLSDIFAVPPIPPPVIPPPAAPALPRETQFRSAVGPPAPVQPARASATPSSPVNAELQKLKNEIRRLEILVRKLQADLQAERQYVASLEEHLKTLQDAE